MIALALLVWSLLGAAPLVTSQSGRPALEVDVRRWDVRLYLIIAGPLVWAALGAVWLWGDRPAAPREEKR